MLDRQYDLSSFQDVINQSNHLAVLLPASASLDTYASAIALAAGLEKTGRSTSVISATPPDSNVVRLLPGTNQIKPQLSVGDLVMSFPYQEGAIDKVSYYIDDGKFYLVIKPKPGFPPVTRENLNFNDTSPEPDHYLVLNLRSLDELGQLYIDHKERLSADKLIQFSSQNTLTNLVPKVSIIDNQASSLAEIIYRTLQGLSIKLDRASASAIILGIESQTAGLARPNLSPDVFTIIADCLRAGGTRFSKPAPIPGSSYSSSITNSTSTTPSAARPATLIKPMSPAVSQAQTPAEPSWIKPVNSA